MGLSVLLMLLLASCIEVQVQVLAVLLPVQLPANVPLEPLPEMLETQVEFLACDYGLALPWVL